MSTKHKSMEMTFMMVKPDGVARGLSGKIFKRLEQTGLKLIAARMILPTESQAKGNYPGTEEWMLNLGEKTYANYHNDEKKIMQDMGTLDKLEIGKRIFKSLTDYITSGPVIITVWEGNHAVERVRRIAGLTDPTRADIGTIRESYSFDTPMLAVGSGRIAFKNLMHISESVEEAQREIEHWFGEKFKDLGDYERIDYIDML